MLLDARNTSEVANAIGADTVIVGAGTVGLCLAVSLARSGRQVVLVESGGVVATTQGNAETAISVGKPHNGPLLSRASGLGGTSVLWGGQLVEFDAADLSRPGREWPISYFELRRWYEPTYRLLGIDPPLSQERYRQALGGEEDATGDVERFFTCWLPQPNLASVFRRQIVSDPNIRIVLNAPANDMLIEDGRAVALLAGAAGRGRICISARTFVLAAGTIANNRFALSLQRARSVPWKDNKNVGTRFQDHLGGKIGELKIRNDERFRAHFENGVVAKLKLQPKLRFAKRKNDAVVSGVCGMFAFRSSVSEHLANLKHLLRSFRSGTGFSELRSLPRDILTLQKVFAPFIARYLRERRVMALLDQGVEFHVQAEQIPVDRSRIALLDGPLAQDGLPRAVVDWQIDGREIAAIRTFIAAAAAYLSTHEMASLIVDPDVADSGALLQRLNDTGHQCGGLQMAATSAAGVTDSDCKIWGTDNVYVAGASVLPSSSYANCTLTALALAVRLADHLVQREQGRVRAA